MNAVAETGATTSLSPEPAPGGARPPKTPACRHCGSPLLTDAARASGFCCAGCAYVHRLVSEGGLGQYYRLKDQVIAPVDSALFQPRDYGWLEKLQRDAEGRARPPGAPISTQAGVADPGYKRPPEMVLDLQGISCVGCVWLIEKLFEREPGALRLELNAQLGRLRMKWRPGRFDAAHFARTLQSFSYFLGPPGAEPSAPPESRDLAKRIGLCTAFAMNIMLFTLPAYFGMEAAFPYARLFGTLAMVFGTLSLLAGGSYFIGRAARAVRDRLLHIDLPIALGIVGAYAGSLYGWVMQDERFTYFDFVGSFILLMLVGRWAQVAAVERNRRRLLRHQPGLQKVRLLAADGNRPAGPVAAEVTRLESPAVNASQPPYVGCYDEIAVEALSVGQVFGVPMGHTTPVEGRLAGGDAVFTTAWINGEAEPRLFRAGQRVPAGAVNVTRGEVRLEALQTWDDSLLAKLLHTEARPGYRHRFFERVIQGYLTGIIGLALAAGLGWAVATGDVQRALAVAIAVLVVSCPCALGLALPLADEMAVTAVRRRGVFVRENDLWVRLGRVRKIIFDKTGTLTLESPALANPEALRALDAGARRALFTLVWDNPHPVGQCLHEQLLVEDPALQPLPGEVSEQVGRGVSLRAGAELWTLGRPGWRGPADRPGLDEPSLNPKGRAEAGAMPAVLEGQVTYYITNPPDAGEAGPAETEFARDGVVLAQFRFAEAVRADARVEVAALRAGGREVFILSGDHRTKVAAMGRELGLPPENAVGEASPEDKAGWVLRLDRGDTLMLGDGANDSLAFERAHCRGTPVIHRGVLESKADFYYLGRGIGGIRKLFEADRVRSRTQRWILAFAVAYNLAAVGFAAAGHMSPLLAAVLMPASALVSLAIVALGMRSCLRG
ncbi:MAG: heavy metal translocating P-type ATPase metal-binding domain-containing protein [Opitutaceae bacterium]|nr:heavy metal translocating P-type ATPase metal-binding domain-containing protein [Opitutaceae bacterium]